jgi:transposase
MLHERSMDISLRDRVRTRCLVAMRADPGRGDVVVLDNLPAHKVAGIRETIARRRAQIFYLPPYSPDMNPIEMAFSKLKALLRHEPARTVDGQVERIGQLLNRFLPAECANFFQAAGYQRSS